MHRERREAALARLDLRAHLPQRLGDRGRRAGGGSTRRRRASTTPLGLPREPAGQQPHQRAGVADVDRAASAARRPAGPGRGSPARPASRTSTSAPSACTARSVEQRVRGVEVARDLHRLGGHRGEQRGAVRDRLVGAARASVPRRPEVAGAKNGHGRATGKPSAAIRPLGTRARRSSPAIHSAIEPVVLSAAGYSAMSTMLTAGAAERERDRRRRRPAGSGPTRAARAPRRRRGRPRAAAGGRRGRRRSRRRRPAASTAGQRGAHRRRGARTVSSIAATSASALER